jgi:hypothetical protein
MIERGAVFSPNGVYRYSLSRVWKREKGLVLFLLLNPSTADANVLDPTLRRCMSFAEAWGYGGILVGNIFALRSTDPQFLYLSRDPIGPTNDFYIKTMVELVDQVVCGWGAHGAYMNRGEEVAKSLGVNLWCLGLTKHGYPKHPLYLKKGTELVPYG